jgi:hypothetical protein
MIRHLHPTDSPRLLTFKQSAGRAEAFSLAQALQGTARQFSSVQYAGIALSPRAWENCWIKTDRARVQAVVRAGPRSGPLAWEVRDLYVRRSYVSEAWDVLEQLAIPAGRSGARRIFIRVFEGSPLYDQARRAGYSPVGDETLYSAPSVGAVAASLGIDNTIEMRPRTSADEGALFRLYCSTTPVTSRLGWGQVTEEWAHASERPAKQLREQVLDDGAGHVTALVQTADLQAGRYFSAVWSHDCEADAASLVAAALADARPDAAAVTLVPAHASGLHGLLAETGFAATATFSVLVKVLAAPVLETRRTMAAVG